VLYRVPTAHFDSFLTGYENLFQHRYGHLRPVVREVVERYLDCGNPMCGFARIRCSECGSEFLVTFSCKRRNSCPSCHASFQPVPIFNDTALTRIFAHEVLGLLVSKHLISPQVREKIVYWRHTGFNVHSKVRATTTEAARRVARYMGKPILALKRLSFDEEEGRVIYQYRDGDTDRVEMDYLDFIARVTAHIPDKGQVMIRYYALYSNAHSSHLSCLRSPDEANSLHHQLRGHRQDHPPPRGRLHGQEASTTCPARGTLLIHSTPEPVTGISLSLCGALRTGRRATRRSTAILLTQHHNLVAPYQLQRKTTGSKFPENSHPASKQQNQIPKKILQPTVERMTQADGLRWVIYLIKA